MLGVLQVRLAVFIEGSERIPAHSVVALHHLVVAESGHLRLARGVLVPRCVLHAVLDHQVLSLKVLFVGMLLVHVIRSFMGGHGLGLRVEELLHVCMGRVNSVARHHALDLGQLVLLLLVLLLPLHLLQEHLVNILADLLCEEVPQLVADLMLAREVVGKRIGVVSFADQDVVVAALSDLNGQSQDFTGSTGGVSRLLEREVRRRTLVVRRSV